MSRMRAISGDAAIALVFFTRLPLPHFDIPGRRLSDALWAAPLAGLAVACCGALVYAVAFQLGMPAGPAATLALAATMLTTGCLHEDGLSDTADGFGGGRTRERKLEIMRDSRIGSYGAAALGLSMLLRFSALAALPGPWAVFWALVAAHMASRALIPAFMQSLPGARADGLSAGAGGIAEATAFTALGLGLVGLLALGISGAVVAALVLAALFLGFRRLCRDQIGGQTGDTLGALQQLAEIVLLLSASALFT